jgi:hypothetical protein
VHALRRSRAMKLLDVEAVEAAVVRRRMLSSNCEIVERAGRHVDVDRLVLTTRGLLIAVTVNASHPTLSRHCNVNSP